MGDTYLVPGAQGMCPWEVDVAAFCRQHGAGRYFDGVVALGGDA